MIFGRPETKSPKDRKAPDGVQPTFMLPTNQSPEWATDSQRHAFCHPFGVLFYLYPLRRSCTPACVMSSPSGTCCPRGYRQLKRPTHSQPRASPWRTWQPIQNALFYPSRCPALFTFSQAVNNRKQGAPVSLKPYAV